MRNRTVKERQPQLRRSRKIVKKTRAASKQPRAKTRRSREAVKTKRAPSKHPGAKRPSLERLQSTLAAKFPSPRLTVELVPQTSWFSNVRDHVTQPDWDRLRREAYQSAGYVCEICGGKGPDHPVECHEIWHYDDLHGTQTLVGLTALCPSCHGVKHFGLTSIRGKAEQAMEHLIQVNCWHKDHARAYLDMITQIWKIRSSRTWELQLSWLSNHGITITKPVQPTDG